MGQKVNPISNRLGIIRGWDSNWFGGRNFGENILEDSQIRKYLDARLAKASVSRIVIERTPKLITITLCTCSSKANCFSILSISLPDPIKGGNFNAKPRLCLV